MNHEPLNDKTRAVIETIKRDSVSTSPVFTKLKRKKLVNNLVSKRDVDLQTLFTPKLIGIAVRNILNNPESEFYK